ncbi:MAG: pilus assembly PilX family protein [Candidatus Binatia bacterium]
MGNQRGMVLFISLTIMSLLMAVGLGVFVSTQNDSRVTANLRRATETFYVAEAGVAWAKQQLTLATNNPPIPADGSQNFSTGSFSVSFLSSNRVSPVLARVVVRSVGVSGTSSQVIQTGMTKTYDLADGAISLKGNSGVSFGGNSFAISGLDHDPADGQIMPGATPRPGISVSAEPALTEVWNRLSSEQRANIAGNNATGIAVSLSDFLPGSAVATLGEQMCNDANAVKQPVPADGILSLVGPTWGTRLNPQIHCVDGLSGVGDSVTLSGSSNGAGILVVRNADLIVNGSLHWEGLIVVTGDNVGLRLAGTEMKEIYGSVIVNENNPTPESGRLMLDLQGTLRVLYSRAALARSAELIPVSFLDGLYSFLPTVITQDYWRTLTP